MASVAAGPGEDAWISALSGWFLVHGHAAFLFLVPAMARSWSLLAGRAPGRLGQRLARHGRAGVWVPVAVISPVFPLPLVLLTGAALTG